MNNPLATLTEQFLKERTYLKNVTPATLVWYRTAFKSYRGSFPLDTAPVPTKAALREVCPQAARAWSSTGHRQHLHRRNERVLRLAARGRARRGAHQAAEVARRETDAVGAR